jgi:hypothetical protein
MHCHFVLEQITIHASGKYVGFKLGYTKTRLYSQSNILSGRVHYYCYTIHTWKKGITRPESPDVSVNIAGQEKT